MVGQGIYGVVWYLDITHQIEQGPVLIVDFRCPVCCGASVFQWTQTSEGRG